MNVLKYFFRFIKHYVNSNNFRHVHSPFVFDLCYNIIKGKTDKDKFKNIELLRLLLLHDTRQININSYGAGSHFKNTGQFAKVKQIVRRTSMNTKLCRLLARIASKINPATVLELGTAAGFSTMYLATQCRNAKIYTIEGSEQIYQLALENFQKLNLDNIIAINNTFENSLEKVLNNIKQLDFVLFDGNHQKEATIDYFYKCLPFTHSNTLFVFDDIYWSKGMMQAWKIIQNHPDVSISIDLFYFGLVFIKNDMIKQHFDLRYIL